MVAISRSEHTRWKEERSGKRGGARQEAHKRTNWYHPLLWIHIDAAAKKSHWSPTGMVSALQRAHPKLFACLNKGTISRWIDESKHQWSSAMLRNVENGHTVSGSGHSGILSQYPHTRDEIIEKLMSLRKSGLPINVVVARSIMITVIQHRIPEFLPVSSAQR